MSSFALGYVRFRICQTTTETVSHESVAPARTTQAWSLGMNCQTTQAKTNNPMLPIEEPAAPMLAALLPRAAPSSPRDSFFSFSCFSMRVTLARKIAGNAKNNPPIPGPNFLAIIPATAVINPPKKESNRVVVPLGLSENRRINFDLHPYFSQT